MSFRINSSREHWIDKIKVQQVLNDSVRLFVCDLHFAPTDIQRHKTKTVLKKNANIIIGCVYMSADKILRSPMMCLNVIFELFLVHKSRMKVMIVLIQV